MVRLISTLALAAHRADFRSRLCFIGLSAIVACCSAYGFFTEYDVWDGITVASAGGVALAALCAVSQFCSLNLSHQARRRSGQDRALCLVLMIVCGCWSAYGLHHFWDVVQLAAAEAAGRIYVPIRSLADVDGSALLMMAICIAIAFVEPLTFWVLGGTSPAPAQVGRDNVEPLDPSRRRPRRAAMAVAAAAAFAAGTMPATVPQASATTVSDSARQSTSTRRDVSEFDVISAADRLAARSERVSLRRLAAELGASKSKVERVLNAAGVSIVERWPPARIAAA